VEGNPKGVGRGGEGHVMRGRRSGRKAPRRLKRGDGEGEKATKRKKPRVPRPSLFGTMVLLQVKGGQVWGKGLDG